MLKIQNTKKIQNTLLKEYVETIIIHYDSIWKSEINNNGGWGRSGYNICHSNNHQSRSDWSGWLDGCPLSPLTLHVRRSWNHTLACWRTGQLSPVEKDHALVKDIQKQLCSPARTSKQNTITVGLKVSTYDAWGMETFTTYEEQVAVVSLGMGRAVVIDSSQNLDM